VAGFIGQMNFLPAQPRGAVNGTVEVEVGGLGRFGAETGNADIGAAGEVVVAVRPEKLFIHAEMPSGAGNTVRCRLENTAYLGDRSHYYVRVEGVDRPLAVAAQNADSEAATRLASRSDLWLTWAPGAMIVLPRED
jgi:ABC-type Fe3+/spermidine/putrescine transport system ATPase subunit